MASPARLHRPLFPLALLFSLLLSHTAIALPVHSVRTTTTTNAQPNLDRGLFDFLGPNKEQDPTPQPSPPPESATTDTTTDDTDDRDEDEEQGDSHEQTVGAAPDGQTPDYNVTASGDDDDQLDDDKAPSTEDDNTEITPFEDGFGGVDSDPDYDPQAYPDNSTSLLTPTPAPLSDSSDPATATGDEDEEDDEDDDEEEDFTSLVEATPTAQGKSSDPLSSAAGSATGGISAIALVGIALAILAPALLIYWVIRRRSSGNSGFETMPAVASQNNVYRGQGVGGTFSVADE